MNTTMLTDTQFIQLSVDNKKSTEQILIKLLEEIGEVSQAFLSLTKTSGSNYKQLNTTDLVEEIIDTQMIINSLLIKQVGSHAVEKVIQEYTTREKANSQDDTNKVSKGENILINIAILNADFVNAVIKNDTESMVSCGVTMCIALTDLKELFNVDMVNRQEIATNLYAIKMAKWASVK